MVRTRSGDQRPRGHGISRSPARARQGVTLTRRQHAVAPRDGSQLVQEGFEREASIRAPAGTAFRVRPLVRDKVLRYLAVRAPSRHQKNLDLASGKLD